METHWKIYHVGRFKETLMGEITIMEPCPVPRTIAIDPGHGDHHNSNRQIDPGAVSPCRKHYEKDIVLEIANAISNILANTGREDTILMTRTGDVTNAGQKLQWRIDKAKSADIFVSIHVNAIEENNRTEGFEVYYKKGDERSKSLAQSIQNANKLFDDRGIKEGGNLYVLNKFDGVAVLVEAGFITNPDDLEIMLTLSERIGEEIATGIINYLEGKS